jgi:hypothetical protein
MKSTKYKVIKLKTKMSSQVEMSIYVSEQLNRQMVNMVQDVAQRCVMECASKYGFDGEEAIRFLNLMNVKMERKAPAKALKAKAVKIEVPKASFPLPYNGEFNENCCFALRQNNGLYTQCTGIRKGENNFCKSCATTLQKTGAEVPEYGTIQQRQATGIFEYTDPKGRKPIAYTKVMKKYKISESQVLEEAGKFNITINCQHFVAPEEAVKRGRPSSKNGEKEEKVKGSKGRPKKSKKVLEIEGDDEDLFATLIAQSNNDSQEEEAVDVKINNKKKGKSDEEKEAERIAKEAEKKQKEDQRLKEKAEKEAKLAAEKAEKEAKKKAEEEARAAKKKAEEEEKAAKKAAAEKAKAEKEAKLAAEKASKKPSKKQEIEEDDEPDVVKKIEFEGKKYLKSKKTGIIYDYTEYTKNGEQVVVGKWNESSNKIDFESAEEEEEEYDM